MECRKDALQSTREAFHADVWCHGMEKTDGEADTTTKRQRNLGELCTQERTPCFAARDALRAAIREGTISTSWIQDNHVSLHVVQGCSFDRFHICTCFGNGCVHAPITRFQIDTRMKRKKQGEIISTIRTSNSNVCKRTIVIYQKSIQSITS